MTEDFLGGVWFGVVACLVIALFVAIVHEIRKTRPEEQETPPDNQVTDIVVDGISFYIDTWEARMTVALLVDTKWKAVADVDFKKLKLQYGGLGPRYIHHTIPINAVAQMKAPRVFGGYV